MLSVHCHTPPALFTIFFILHHEMTSEVLDAPALAADAGVDNDQGRVVAKVEVFSMPRPREETSRSISCNFLSLRIKITLSSSKSMLTWIEKKNHCFSMLNIGYQLLLILILVMLTIISSWRNSHRISRNKKTRWWFDWKRHFKSIPISCTIQGQKAT